MMLELLRRKSQSKVIQVTIVIIILVFVFWGVGTNQGSGRNAVATVNGESILYQEYQKKYDQMYNNMRDQFGGNIPKGLLEATNFKRQVLMQLIHTTLLRQEAKDIGLYVSDNELRESIEKMEVFKNNGEFDVKWYEEVLTGSKMTVSSFEDGMRYDLLDAKVVDKLSRFGQVSENELLELYRYNFNKVKFDFAVFQASKFKNRVETTDEKVAAYFENNKESYKSSPQVKLKYITLPLDINAAAEAVSEDEIKQYYQVNIARYSHPEQRKASHILLRLSPTATEEEVASKRKNLSEILLKINNNNSFEELAKTHSEDPGSAQQGGDLGYFSRGQMVKPFEEATFALKEGEVSEIIQTSFGLHIIKLTALKPAGTTPLEELKDTIAHQLKTEKAKDQTFKIANDTYESIILAGSLDNYATSTDEKENNAPEINKTKLFSRQNPPDQLKALPSLLNSAFSLKQGELSSILETRNGYAILYVEERKDPALQELKNVKKRVSEDYKNAEAINLAEEAANALLDKLKEGADFKKELEALEIPLEITEFVSRSAPSSPGIPSDILTNNFNLSESNKYADTVSRSGDRFFVLAYKESQEPDENIFKEQKERLATELKARKADTLVVAWINFLKENAQITINEELL